MLGFKLALVGFWPSSTPRCAGSPRLASPCLASSAPRCAARGGRRRGRRATPDRLFKRFFAPGGALYAALVGVAFARTVGLGKQLWYKTPEQGLPALARTRPLKALREPHTGRFCPDGARSLQDPLALSLTVAPTQVSRPRSPGVGSGRSPRHRPVFVPHFQVVFNCTGNRKVLLSKGAFRSQLKS